MTRLKIAISLAALLFLVLIGAGAASAYWTAQAAVSSTVTAATLSDSCQNVTTVVNASFEQPAISASAGWTDVPNGSMPGWQSTDPAGIEVWQSGANGLGVNAPVGNQFVELNANMAGTLSQTISTTPGQILQWSLLHHGRVGVDTMQVSIGALNGIPVAQGNYSDGTSAWGRHSGAYIVPAGQTSTTLSLTAISTATGDTTVGNFLDDVSFGSGPCLAATSSVSDITRPGTTYQIGDVIQYVTTVQNTGSTPAMSSILRNTVPTSLTYQPGSLVVAGAGQTDGADGDVAEYAAGTGAITARLGIGATSSAGGSIAQNTTTTFSFRAIVTGPAGATIDYAPVVGYVNALAPLWGQSVTAANVPILATGVPDVAVAATAVPATLVPGAAPTSVWSFSVTNVGTLVANGVVVHLVGPAGVTGITSSVGATPCTVISASAVDCTIGNLPIGAANAKTITFTGGVVTGTAPGPFSVVATATTTSTESNTGNNSVTATSTVADVVAPTVGVLSASATTTTQTKLSWTAATDNVGVTAYDLYRGGVLVETASTLTYTDTGLTPGTTYLYTLKARDAAGNPSAASNQVSVLTASVFAANTNYLITSMNSTPTNLLCIDVDGTSATKSAANGALLIISTCDSTDRYQNWSFVPTNPISAYFEVLPKVNAAILGWDFDAGGGTANGTKAQLWSYGAGSNQQWKPVADAVGGTFHFVNFSTQKCLNVPNASTTPGTALQQYTCNNSTSQSFMLTAVN
jgi:uncharacterized repeat protein (TIGR01451 family)